MKPDTFSCQDLGDFDFVVRCLEWTKGFVGFYVLFLLAIANLEKQK